MEEGENTIQVEYDGHHTLEFMSKDFLGKLYDLAMRFPIINADGKFKVTIEFHPEDEVEDE